MKLYPSLQINILQGRILYSVNTSLRLQPESRNSMLLKSNILKAMGKNIEAKQIEGEALFLPEPNWHESTPIK